MNNWPSVTERPTGICGQWIVRVPFAMIHTGSLIVLCPQFGIRDQPKWTTSFWEYGRTFDDGFSRERDYPLTLRFYPRRKRSRSTLVLTHTLPVSPIPTKIHDDKDDFKDSQARVNTSVMAPDAGTASFIISEWHHCEQSAVLVTARTLNKHGDK